MEAFNLYRFLTGSRVCPKSNGHAGDVRLTLDTRVRAGDVFVLSEKGSSRSCLQASGIVRDSNRPRMEGRLDADGRKRV